MLNTPSLDGPAPYFAAPGPDQRPQELDELVDKMLALIGADRMISPQEQRSVQRLMSGIEAIAATRAAQQAGEQGEDPNAFSGDTPEEFGTQEGAEPLDDSGLAEGAEYMQG